MADCYLGVVDWNKDYKHVLKVNSGSQFNDVMAHMNTHSHKPIHITDIGILKLANGTGTLKADGYYSNFHIYNYILFRNDNNTNYYYAFIDSLEFIAPKTTHIHFTIDVWQMFTGSLTFKNSFVERMHIAKSEDTVGRWLAPEPFSPNFSVTQNSQDVTPTTDWARFCWLETVSYPDKLDPNEPFKFGGVFSDDSSTAISGATGFYDIDTSYLNASQFDALLNLYANLELGNDHRKDLLQMKCVPGWVWNNSTNFYTFEVEDNKTDPPTTAYISIKDCNDVTKNYTTTPFANNLACGYTPNNNKLYTSLCNQYLIYNNNGLKKVYMPENFTDGYNSSHTITLVTNTYSSTTIMVLVNNYSDKSNQYFSLPYNCTLPITYDGNATIANKLSALGNLVTSSLNSVSNATGNLQSFVSGNYYNTGGLGSSLSSLQNTAMDYLQRTAENFVTVGNASDFTTTRPANICIRFARISPLTDQCREIDNYLTTYGYSINEIMLPTITSRSNWNYLKGDINFTCNALENDKQTLKNIFSSGVTVWHNPTNMLNYSATNN